MGLAAIRYSKALFNLAIEKNDLENYYLACQNLNLLLEENEDFYNILSNPTIIQSEKLDILEKSFKNKIPDGFLGLLSLLIKRRRESILPRLLSNFDNLYLEYKQIARAKVYSAKGLDSNQINMIRAEISRKLNKIIEIENIIDDSLIAGFIIETDDYLFDASMKSRINNIKKDLLNISK